MFLGFSTDLWEFIAIAISFGAIAFILAQRFPASSDADPWRQIWTVADILAVLLTVVGVAKLMSPLLVAEQIQQDAYHHNSAIRMKENIIYSVNKGQDEFCPVGEVKADAISKCDVIRKMQRSLLLPSADVTTARGILNNDLPRVCSQQQCDQIFQDIRMQATQFMEFAKKHPAIFSGIKVREPEEIRHALFFVFLYIAVTSFRLGRSGSEFARNRLAQKAAKAGKLSTDDRFDAIYRRLERIDRAITPPPCDEEAAPSPSESGKS